MKVLVKGKFLKMGFFFSRKFSKILINIVLKGFVQNRIIYGPNLEVTFSYSLKILLVIKQFFFVFTRHKF